MTPIIDVTHADAPKPNPVEIPARGYYVRLRYENAEDVTTGPFTNGDKPLLVEFLNVLEAMRELYPSGKSDFDDYAGIPGHDRWFDPETFDETPADERRRELSVLVEFDDDGWVAWLKDYECVWHDGKSADPHETTLVRRREIT